MKNPIDLLAYGKAINDFRDNMKSKPMLVTKPEVAMVQAFELGLTGLTIGLGLICSVAFDVRLIAHMMQSTLEADNE